MNPRSEDPRGNKPRYYPVSQEVTAEPPCNHRDLENFAKMLYGLGRLSTRVRNILFDTIIQKKILWVWVSIVHHGYLRDQGSCFSLNNRSKITPRMCRRHKTGDKAMPATRAKQMDMAVCVPVPSSENMVIQSATTNEIILIHHHWTSEVCKEYLLLTPTLSMKLASCKWLPTIPYGFLMEQIPTCMRPNDMASVIVEMYSEGTYSLFGRLTRFSAVLSAQ